MEPTRFSVYIGYVAYSPDIFAYLDYRTYLRDYYLQKKAQTRGFSFRVFSRRAQLGSPNYLKLVMDGERNLTGEMAARFARACNLDGEAAQYFIDLVGFNQAKDSRDRDDHYSRIAKLRSYQNVHPLELEHEAYHSNWYIPAIRELAARSDFQEDPEWIERMLIPSVPPDKVEQALHILQKLGLLVRDDDGRLQQKNAVVSTGAETQGVHIARYHRAMLERASQSIDLVPAANRDISSLTLCLGNEGLRRLKERIQSLRRELLELSALEQDPNQVVQVNFQLFPLSHAKLPPKVAKRGRPRKPRPS